MGMSAYAVEKQRMLRGSNPSCRCTGAIPVRERAGLFRQRRQRRVGRRGARRDAYPQRADLSARWFTELDGAPDVRGGRILVRPLRLCVAANA